MATKKLKIEGVEVEVTDEEPPATTKRTNWNAVIDQLRIQAPSKWVKVKGGVSATMATNLKKRAGVDARMSDVKDSRGTLWIRVQPQPEDVAVSE